MNEEIFNNLYKKLNPKQRAAVDAIDGPVIVIAGPGTGKTSILTLRIANILKLTDTAPESILALTFTESGVHSIRKKLVEIIGATGYRVSIHTFHNFCNDVIKSFPQEFPRIIGAQHVTDFDQINILEELINSTKLVSLKPTGSPLFYLKSILSFIKELKREDVSPEEYLKHAQSFEDSLMGAEDLRHEKGAYKGEIKAKYKPALRKIENSREFALVYEKYQAALEEKRLYDYEDMIVEVLRELRENKNLLLELQETHQYILADEHQDANRGQNRLLELLSGFHERPNLFVVGDEKQAIFRFQGASLENFLYFKKRFPEAEVIALNKNYRSTQGILDASHSLMAHSPTGTTSAHVSSDKKDASVATLAVERVRLESKDAEVKANIQITECDSPPSELVFIARHIQEKIKNGARAEEMAVLFRDNRDAGEMARTFQALDVPFVLHTDIDVIGHEYIQKLLYILRAVDDFGNEMYMTPVLFLDLFGLSHLDVYKILGQSRKSHRSVVEIIKSRTELEKAEVEEPEKFLSLFELLHDLSVIAKNKSLVDALQEVVSRTGYIGFLISKPRALELLAAYDALLAHAIELLERHKDVRLGNYLNLLGKMAEHNVSVRAKGVSSYPGKVNLMTAHKSKGLEFDYVYCAHLNDGRWGGRRNSTYFLPIGASNTENIESDVSDERRLFYVVLTRARKEIMITYATHGGSGRELLPSQFLQEIDPSLVQAAKEEILNARVINQTEPLVHGELDIRNKEYLAGVFLEHGFSVSALNNYLTCPWRFFFLNMLRVPNAQERFQLYGTAIHETLRVFFDAYKQSAENGEKNAAGETLGMAKEDMLGFFEKFLNRKALSETDYELFLEKGRTSLGGYFDEYKGTWPKDILNEFNISGVHIELDHKDSSDKSENEKTSVLLRGQLDKVEFLDARSVNVVDYKTGTPKSRRDIEGDTKSSDGNYKRQLVFYKLLIDRHDKANLRMETGEIDFVEPNKQGKYKREKFVVTEEEVDALIEVVKKASEEILTLSFWNRECEDDDCNFCEMRKLLEMQ